MAFEMAMFIVISAVNESLHTLFRHLLSLCVGILGIETPLSCGVFNDYSALEP